MPYIDQAARVRLRHSIPQTETSGELNYVLTVTVLDYLARHGTKYATINDCLGALEGCKLELYRRFAAPYEDVKIESNGDVFPL
jgi:hypothetical protein